MAWVVDERNIPVMCYGLRTDFRGELFGGSAALLAWADALVEQKTICHCGRKATMVVRVGLGGRVEKEGDQVEIGGNQGNTHPGEIRAGNRAAIGKVLGPSFARADVPDVIGRLIDTYLALRDSDAERFIDVVHRVGIEPFKKNVYGHADPKPADRPAALAA